MFEQAANDARTATAAFVEVAAGEVVDYGISRSTSTARAAMVAYLESLAPLP